MTHRTSCQRPLEPLSREYEGYIFDLDGTLADSMPVHYYAWKQALEENGATFDFTWELFYDYAGVGALDCVAQWNRQFATNLSGYAVLERQHQLLMQGIDRVEPIAAVVAAAQVLKGEGRKIAVASGGERSHVLDTLRIIGLEHFFPVVVTKDDVARSKPDPETFLLATQQLEVEPQRCLVFEDSLVGIRAAKAAGMDWVHIVPPRHLS